MIEFKKAKAYILDRLEKELQPNLYYHGIHHTLDVYEASIRIAELEGLSQEEKILVNTAALYHDSGFLFKYEHNEELAVELVGEILPQFGYDKEQVQIICNIILTTRVKARPYTLLEKIMCDADYDYLGRDDVERIADSLYRELLEYDFRLSPPEWNELQIRFLNKHQYYTTSSLLIRRPKKLDYIEQLKSRRY